MSKQTVETHKYSKACAILKIVSISFLGMLLFFIVLIPIRMLLDPLELDLPISRKLFNDIKAGFILINTIYISFILHHFLLNKLFDTCSTYMYITKELKTNITFAEAKYLRQLFEPDYLKNDTWVTMQNILSLPENMRHKAIMDAASRILKSDK